MLNSYLNLKNQILFLIKQNCLGYITLHEEVNPDVNTFLIGIGYDIEQKLLNDNWSEQLLQNKLADMIHNVNVLLTSVEFLTPIEQKELSSSIKQEMIHFSLSPSSASMRLLEQSIDSKFNALYANKTAEKPTQIKRNWCQFFSMLIFAEKPMTETLIQPHEVKMNYHKSHLN